MSIFESHTLNGERAFVFEVDQVLHAEKSFLEWSATFCQEYFASHAAADTNQFLLNSLTFDYCVELTWHCINMSSIDRAIRA